LVFRSDYRYWSIVPAVSANWKLGFHDADEAGHNLCATSDVSGYCNVMVISHSVRLHRFLSGYAGIGPSPVTFLGRGAEHSKLFGFYADLVLRSRRNLALHQDGQPTLAVYCWPMRPAVSVEAERHLFIAGALLFLVFREHVAPRMPIIRNTETASHRIFR
jgi:hypothetical protein